MISIKIMIWCANYIFTFFSFFKTIFESSCRFGAKLIGRYREFPYTSCSYTDIASPTVNIPTRVVPLLQLMKLPWHILVIQSPEFALGFTLGFYRFGQMHPALQYHAVYFPCLKNPLCPTLSSLPSPDSSQPPIPFLLSPSVCLFQNAIKVEPYSTQPSQMGFFHLVTMHPSPALSFHGLMAHFLLAE